MGYTLYNVFYYDKDVRTVETEVLVASGQKHLLPDRLKVCKLLWEAKIPVL